MTSKNPQYGYQTGTSLVILVVALFLLVGQSVFFLYKAGEILDREAQQENAGVVLLRLREVSADIQDAETGQRGYLLTGTPSYLEPYNRAVADIGEHMRQSKALLASDPRSTTQLTLLQNLIDKKLEELNETIQLRRNGQLDAAIYRVQDGSGKKYMDEARAILRGVLDDVRNARTEVNHEISRRVRTAEYVLVSIALTIIIMVGIATTQMMLVIRKNEELTLRLANESTHDVLTGLPNRRLLYTWLDKAINQAVRKKSKASVLFMDLDGFKKINDIFGHETGDVVLCAVTQRFNQVLRNADLLARFGGDEFAVVVSEEVSREDLAVLARRLQDALVAPLLPNLAANPVGASIGIAIFPEHGNTPDQIVSAADKAMYEAKRACKGSFCFAADVG